MWKGGIYIPNYIFGGYPGYTQSTNYKPSQGGFKSSLMKRKSYKGMARDKDLLKALKQVEAKQHIPRPLAQMNFRMKQTKFFDTTGAAAVASGGDWTGTEVPCSSYIQSDGATVGAYTDSALIPSAIGAGYGQVQGTKYWIKKIRIKGMFTPTVTSDQADSIVGASLRISLVHDMQPNGAQIQGENIYTDLGSAQQCQFSFLNLGSARAGAVRILKDRFMLAQPAIVSTDGTNTSSQAWNNVKFSFTYTPKNPIPVRLLANSAVPTIASLSDSNIFMLCHSDRAGTLNFGARCYYCD